jgi:iron complex outermembrane receptor protein
LFSAFLQDEITIVDNRWHFTLGSKIEHNDYTGFEAQPSGRLSWTPSTRQTVWASVSRAVRTPSAVDTGVRQNRAIIPSSSGLPTLVAVVGNPDFSSEELLAHELGYRIECTPRLSFDMAAFYNVYDDLRDFVPTEGQLETDPAPPHWLMPVVAQNRVEGETYGAEWETEWRVTDKWKMKAGYTWLEMQLHSELATSKNDDSPQNQFHLSSYLDLPRHVELNGAVYYVDNITQGEVSTRIPSYVRLDVGVTWRPVRSLECGLWGQNLLDDQHSEFTSYKTTNIEAIPRSVVGRIAWAF